MLRRTILARTLLSLALGGVTLVACDCGDDPVPPCESANPPAACGTACTGSPSACTGGTYCGPSGVCTADCVVGDGNCGPGEVCDPTDGRCVEGTGGGSGGGTGSGGGAGGGDGGVCQDLSVVADPLEPYIVFVVDKSGSMASNYGSGQSRWQAVRSVLVGTGGVIEQFQSGANIALVQYTGVGTYNGSTASITGLWPTLTETPAKLDNLTDITADYGASNPPIENDTPTGEALWVTMCHLGLVDADGDGAFDDRIGCASYENATNASAIQQPWLGTPPDGEQFLLPPVGTGPGQRDPNAKVVLVLATDGLPNSSVNPDADEDPTGADAIEARDWAIDAADEARNAGILTYVISVAGSNDLDLHLEHVACQGGTGPLPQSAPFGGANGETICTNGAPASGPGLAYADNSTALRDALDTIVGEIPCEFQLDGMVNDVSAARAQGVVTVGGVIVALDASNGWYLADDGRTFSLNGTACESFRAAPGSELEATFPCGSGIVIIPL